MKWMSEGPVAVGMSRERNQGKKSRLEWKI